MMMYLPKRKNRLGSIKELKYIQQYIKDRPQSDTAKDMKKYLATQDKDSKDSEDSVDTKTMTQTNKVKIDTMKK